MNTNSKNDREYLTFNPAKGYPADKTLFYECLDCNEVVPSMPNDNAHCKCRNIMIDIDYGRIDIQDVNKVRLFKRI